jgi:hypothetical protein
LVTRGHSSMTFPSIIFTPSRALPHPRILHRVAQSVPQTAKFGRRDAKPPLAPVLSSRRGLIATSASGAPTVCIPMPASALLNAFAPRAPIKPTVTMASYVPFGTVVRIGALHRPGAPARALRICAALGLLAPPTNRWSCSSLLK